MYMKQFFMDLKLNICFVCKWLCIAMVLGVVCGVVGALFHIAIDYVTDFRMSHSWIVWGLPLGGLAIVYLYRLVHLVPPLPLSRFSVHYLNKNLKK